MQYFDGELDEPRRSAVAAFLGADLQARNKLTGLRITSAIVQNEALSSAAADGIADLVMARIAAEPRELSAPAALDTRPSAGAAQLPVQLVTRSTPANDNSRRIFALLGTLAVAAAAVFALWGRPGAAPTEPVRPGPIAAIAAPTTPPASTSVEPEIDAAGLTADIDVEHGVEVAAVDFGAHMGSIFYVPSGSIEAKRVTTVVWLADDAGE